MIYIEQILANHILLASVASWGVSQICKIITNLVIERKFDIKRLFGDGGMPSGHSATVTCLAVMSGHIAGFDSIMFAIAMILAIVVMHDATGVRREAGKHAVSIKELADAVNKSFLGESESIRTENLKVLVGHTPLQVVFGALVGIIIAILYIIIFLA